MLENTLDNIFTDYDESIFSDSSIDPMGLRIIWTSLGGKIFHNKLNTVSTDIKLYTLNLFHHYLIQKCITEEVDSVNQLIRKKPYFNKADLYEGLIIFLENVLIHATYNANNSALIVPGKNKLSNLKKNGIKNNLVNKIAVNREQGILVRQYLLGIHGRHKGPFIQMGVFNENTENIYSNQEIWNEAASIFNDSPWKDAAVELIDLIKNKLLKPNTKSGAFIEYNVEDVLTQKIESTYVVLLNKEIYYKSKISNFWLNRLGLTQSTAGVLFTEYLNQKPNVNYQQIILKACNDSRDKLLMAITAIEPLLTLVEKSITRLLILGTINIDNELAQFFNEWLDNNEVDVLKIQSFLSLNYLSQDAINRVQKLLDIYSNAKSAENQVEYFITYLIKYHQDIMKTRGNLSWISIGVNNNISVHRSINRFDPTFSYLKSKDWVNTYYLPTVESLHKGLTNEAI